MALESGRGSKGAQELENQLLAQFSLEVGCGGGEAGSRDTQERLGAARVRKHWSYPKP
jgi:hypothetical protein